MYKLGIIGGMGPLASANFYEKIILNTKASKDGDHIDLVLLNHASIPDRTQSILEGKEEEFLHEIQKDFEILKNIGVDLVAIPCNTSHYFYDSFKKITDLRIINMIEESILKIKALGFKKAAVFGTLGTLNSKVYNKYASKHEIEIVPLADGDKAQIMDIIYHIKESNKLDASQFNNILKTYCDEETMGIVACTELSLLEIDGSINSIDSLNVLVEKSILLSGKALKEENA